MSRATCYPNPKFISALGDKYVKDEAVIVDGYCVTSMGPATAINFALKIVEVLLSKEKSDTVAKAMLV